MVNQEPHSSPEEHEPVPGEAIARQLACTDFPWDITRALELALFRSFAGPRIARLLDATGEFGARARRRYDDTVLLLAYIIELGPNSALGRRALCQMNAIHGQFKIANEDFLYVLSTFIFEPLRWIDRFGWRALSEAEREAWFDFWCAVGRAMNIADIPPTPAAFEAASRAYEAEHFVFSKEARAVAMATMRMFAGPAPSFLHPLVRSGIAGLLDERLRVAVGFLPAPIMGVVVRAVLDGRKRVLRHLPKRKRAQQKLTKMWPTHPEGFVPETLGPPSFLRRR